MSRMVWRACLNCVSSRVFRAFKAVEKSADRLSESFHPLHCPLSHPADPLGPGPAGRVGPVFVAMAIVFISCCAVTFYDVVWTTEFLQSDSWLYFLYGTLVSCYLVLMFSYHCERHSITATLSNSSIHSTPDYKAITVRPGSPLDPPRAFVSPRSLGSLIPAALCFGPLRSLHQTRRRDNTRHARAIREIQAAQQERAASGNGSASPRVELQQKDSSDGRAGRRARTCKKCPLTADGTRPPKPGELLSDALIGRTTNLTSFPSRAIPSLLRLQSLHPQVRSSVRWTTPSSRPSNDTDPRAEQLSLDQAVCRLAQRALLPALPRLLLHRLRIRRLVRMGVALDRSELRRCESYSRRLGFEG